VRKITVFTLALFIFALASFPVSALSYESHEAEKAQTLFSDLDIEPTVDDYGSSLTRGEFSSFLDSALSLNYSSDGGNLPFTDVDETSVFYESISNLYDFGIISASKNFYPERVITYNEAVKMAVCALGYDWFAENAYGGYPIGYNVIASKVGLTVGVGNVSFNWADAYNLMYNMLTVNLPEMEFKNNEVNYRIEGGKTLLETIYGISFVNAVFTAGQYFGGDDGNGAGEGLCGADDYVFKSGDFDTDSFFGMEADIFFDEKNEIVSVFAYDDKNVLEISSGQILGFENRRYSFEKDGKVHTSKAVARDALIVYNGKKSEYSLNEMTPENGSVKLVGVSSEYDTVIINSYEEIVVDNISSVDHTVSDARKKSSFVTLDSDKKQIRFYSEDGKEVDFETIGKHNVLWIGESRDKNYCRVIVCRDVVTGELTGKGNGYVLLDNERFEASDEALNLIGDSVKLMEVVRAHFNPDGEIAYFSEKTDEESVNVGYLIESSLSKSGLSEKILVRILSDDGIIKTYELSERFSVNGISFSDTIQENYEKLPKDAGLEKSMLTGLVSYNFDASRKINAINYPDDTASQLGGTFYELYYNGTVSHYDGNPDPYIRYRSSNRTLYGKGDERLIMKSDSKHYVIPEAADAKIADEEDYVVKQMSSYSDMVYMPDQVHKGYSLKKDGFESDYLVSTYSLSAGLSESVPSSEILYMITSSSSVIDSEGMEAEKIEVIDYAGNTLTLYSGEDRIFSSLGLSEGDLIKASYNTKYEVSGVLLVYKAGEKEFSNKTNLSSTEYSLLEDNTVITNDSGMAFMATSYIVLGNAVSKDGNVLGLCSPKKDMAQISSASELLKYNITFSHPLVMFDTKTKTMSKVDFSAIETYEDFNKDIKIVVQSNTGFTNSFFAYK